MWVKVRVEDNDRVCSLHEALVKNEEASYKMTYE